MSIQITEEFAAALQSMNEGQNVLITGNEGTGKSTLLKTFVEQSGGKDVLVVAPTTAAALNVDGRTIQKAFGFTTNTVSSGLDNFESTWEPSVEVRNGLKNLDTLVVDDAAMLDADLFDLMDRALRQARNSETAFGGAQLMLAVDVSSLSTAVISEDSSLFDSQSYSELNLEKVDLTRIWGEEGQASDGVREGSAASLGSMVQDGDRDGVIEGSNTGDSTDLGDKFAQEQNLNPYAVNPFASALQDDAQEKAVEPLSTSGDGDLVDDNDDPDEDDEELEQDEVTAEEHDEEGAEEESEDDDEDAEEPDDSEAVANAQTTASESDDGCWGCGCFLFIALTIVLAIAFSDVTWLFNTILVVWGLMILLFIISWFMD